jgi:hypothetical protein
MSAQNDRIERLEQQSDNYRTNIGQISDKVADVESRWNKFEGRYKTQYLPFIEILNGEKSWQEIRDLMEGVK